jgi:hypothetical protein
LDQGYAPHRKFPHRKLKPILKETTMGKPTVDDHIRALTPEWRDRLGLRDGTWEIVKTEDGWFQYRMTDLGIAKLKRRRGETSLAPIAGTQSLILGSNWEYWKPIRGAAQFDLA